MLLCIIFYLYDTNHPFTDMLAFHISIFGSPVAANLEKLIQQEATLQPAVLLLTRIRTPYGHGLQTQVAPY